MGRNCKNQHSFLKILFSSANISIGNKENRGADDALGGRNGRKVRRGAGRSA
jgi:hypothetical protein